MQSKMCYLNLEQFLFFIFRHSLHSYGVEMFGVFLSVVLQLSGAYVSHLQLVCYILFFSFLQPLSRKSWERFFFHFMIILVT